MVEVPKSNDILSQRITGRTVGGRGPRIEPSVLNPLINEGAHTYVAQELQPYLNIWKKNNPGKKVINFHVGEPAELPLESILKEGAKIHIEAYLASVASSIFGGRFKESVRPYYERAKKKFASQTWINARNSMGLDPNPDLRKNPEESIRTAASMIQRGQQNAWKNCL